MAYPNYTVYMHHLADQLTPMALRTDVWRALMQAILKPIDTLSTGYRTFRDAKRQRMNHNGQVRLLERICNKLMVGGYSVNAPLIYLDEPDPVNDFLIAPDGNWVDQGLIHYNETEKYKWDVLNPNPLEAPERYSVLHDRSGHTEGLGFEVHLTPALDEDAPTSTAKTKYYANGGDTALKEIVDTYKLAGKRYVIIQDEE